MFDLILDLRQLHPDRVLEHPQLERRSDTWLRPVQRGLTIGERKEQRR